MQFSACYLWSFRDSHFCSSFSTHPQLLWGDVCIILKIEVGRNVREPNWFCDGRNLQWAVGYMCMLLEGRGFPLLFPCLYGFVMLYNMHLIKMFMVRFLLICKNWRCPSWHWKQKYCLEILIALLWAFLLSPFSEIRGLIEWLRLEEILKVIELQAPCCRQEAWFWKFLRRILHWSSEYLVIIVLV